MTVLYDSDPDDESVEHAETGLCDICGEDAAVPNDDFCRSCIAEIERSIWELENQDDAA